MVKGAVKTSEFLFHGSEYAKQHIAPEGVRAVDPKVGKCAQYFRLMISSLISPGPGWSGDGPLGEHGGVPRVRLAGEQGGLRHGGPGQGGGAPRGEGGHQGSDSLLIPVKRRVKTADRHRGLVSASHWYISQKQPSD